MGKEAGGPNHRSLHEPKWRLRQRHGVNLSGSHAPIRNACGSRFLQYALFVFCLLLFLSLETPAQRGCVPPCDINAECRNTSALPECICNRGYVGDGVNCTGLKNSETHTHTRRTIPHSIDCHIPLNTNLTSSDIDECSVGKNLCDPNALCTNTEGNYVCRCISGFVGDGMTCQGIAPQNESWVVQLVQGPRSAFLSEVAKKITVIKAVALAFEDMRTPHARVREILRTKIRKWVPTKRNTGRNAAF